MNKLFIKKSFILLSVVAFIFVGLFINFKTAFAVEPTVKVYQTTLGSPSGDPQGNVFISGSATPFLTARDAAIIGTLTSRTTYTPLESSVWGTSGSFGSELYIFSVIKDIPVGSLLKITKSIDYKDVDTPDWKSFTNHTLYYPMTAYTHATSSTAAIDYLTKFDCLDSLCTFVTGAGVGEDYSASNPNGSANTPPTDISKSIGFQLRHTINVQVITGSWVLTDESLHSRGYQQGTGYTGGNTPMDLGTLVNTSIVPNPTTVYIDPSYTTTSCGSHECYYDAFPTIQAGINAVSPGGTVNVAAGIYTEKITLNKPNITVVSTAGPATTIIDVPGTGLYNGVEVLANMGNVTFDGFTVKNFTQDGIKQSYLQKSGTAFHVLNNIVIPKDDYLRNGIEVTGNGSSVVGNTIYGKLLTAEWSSCGIQVDDASNTDVLNNTILGAPTQVDYGICVAAWDYNIDDVLIQGNNISGAKNGIGLVTGIYGPRVISNVSILSNIISSSDNGITASSSSSTDVLSLGGTINIELNKFNNIKTNNLFIDTNVKDFELILDATNNWWGTAVLADIQAKISGNVIYSPWFANETMTSLGNTTILIDDKPTVTLPAPITTNITTTEGVVQVSIPSGIVITGPVGWDGTVATPTITTNTVAPVADSGNTASVVGSIEVGFSNMLLTFNKAVQLVFAGQAGNSIGYSHGAGTFKQITTLCTGDNNETTQTGNIGEGADCKMEVDGDLVVWTKHFSLFTTYTQKHKNNNSSGSYGATPAVRVTKLEGCKPGSNDLFDIYSGKSCTIKSEPVAKKIGQVLGAENYNFTKFMKNGSKGVEVIELQKFLNLAGFDCGLADGKFGKKTHSAVIKFQLSKGIKGDGKVGPMTREFLK